jgi:SAM-dependent methyltransferase
MPFTTFTVARQVKLFFMDRIEIDPSGVIRVGGWSRVPFESKTVPRVYLDHETVPFVQHYRVTRPDVESTIQGIKVLQAGLVFEYIVPESMCSRQFQSISVDADNLKVHFAGPFDFINPHYRGLFDSPQVYHRENIYGSGPPNSAINSAVLALARTLEGPVLDFGCGSGALITDLRARGIEAHGLELDTPVIRESIKPVIRPFIKLYDGDLPSPFSAGDFNSVFCSEVLEHIPQYEGAIAEIACLATKKAILTVPDASAIPLGYPHLLIPWHLLEGTHVNFFNQTNLRRALEPHFSKIDFGRICPCTMNDSSFHVSLVAVCLK